MSEESKAWMYKREKVVRARHCVRLAYQTREFDDLLNAIDELVDLHEQEIGITQAYEREERVMQAIKDL